MFSSLNREEDIGLNLQIKDFLKLKKNKMDVVGTTLDSMRDYTAKHTTLTTCKVSGCFKCYYKFILCFFFTL